MSYELLVDGSDYEELEDRYKEDVIEAFDQAVEKKQKELDWINNFNQLSRRFHNFFGRGDLHIAELAFQYENRKFRGIFFSNPDLNKLPLLEVVEKKGTNKSSRQCEVLNNIFSNKSQVMENALNRVEEEVSYS